MRKRSHLEQDDVVQVSLLVDVERGARRLRLRCRRVADDRVRP